MGEYSYNSKNAIIIQNCKFKRLFRSFPYTSCKKIPKEPRSNNFKKVYKRDYLEIADKICVWDHGDGRKFIFNCCYEGFFDRSDLPQENIPSTKNGVYLFGLKVKLKRQKISARIR